MADAFSRAVAELGVADLPTSARLEIAGALDALTESGPHLLQTLYRAHFRLLTEPGLLIVGGDVAAPLHLRS
ncbi:hypothetical protein SAMN05192568_10688 [Methylobacterium pseudosasicola]|uniref:Uncharacterized protein n=2 Tax=Methylobacterium pseudosasicola TaxID=582667 RepID=A0A1I4UD89_9HYPH|nr:hypothetical protein SAMN05192568_10688 [Methylobacterium pseudosasicola]